MESIGFQESSGKFRKFRESFGSLGHAQLCSEEVSDGPRKVYIFAFKPYEWILINRILYFPVSGTILAL
jgi:hypothetical protein